MRESTRTVIIGASLAILAAFLLSIQPTLDRMSDGSGVDKPTETCYDTLTLDDFLKEE